VIGPGGLEIGLIVGTADGLVRRVTTFEALDISRADAAVSREYADRIWKGIAESVGPPAALLLCTPEVFERWLAGPAKQAGIDTAIQAGAAVLINRLAP
jgi:hypothetical protein